MPSSTKQDKKTVKYGPGMTESHCAICRHYDDHKCSLVAGKIDPAYWCTLFHKVKSRPKPVM